MRALAKPLRQRAVAGDALKTAIVESALDSVVTMDHRGTIIEFNPSAERTFGYSKEEAVGADLADLLLPEALRDAHRRGLERYMATGKAVVMDRRLELVAKRANGEEFPVELTITRIGKLEPAVFAGYIRDLTVRRKAEREAAAQHGVARVLAESISVDEAIPRLLEEMATSMEWELSAGWLVDEKADVLRCHSVWQDPELDATSFRDATLGIVIAKDSGPLGRVWGTGAISTSEDAILEPGYRRIEAAQREGLHEALWVPIRSGPHVVGVLEFYRRSPNPLDAALLGTLSAIGSQIGEFFRRRRVEKKLAYQALHDGLTGLANRELLLDRLAHALKRAERGAGKVGVLFMDIDDFKLVNDSLGHDVGDKLLVAVANRLRAVVRTSDTTGRLESAVARLGGDEFIIVCEGLESEHDGARVAARIKHHLDRPFLIDGGHELVVSASMGIALDPYGHGDPDRLLGDADAAMYSAKERGRGLCEVFDDAMRSRVLERVAGEAELRRAIEREEFELVYQPIVSVSDGLLHGFEALIRWHHPERGLLSPAAFIPLAEQTSLILPIGRWVIGEACRQAALWREHMTEDRPVRIAVNLSPRQLADPTLIETVEAALSDSGLTPGALALEITESHLMEEGPHAIDALLKLQALGVDLHLDDFGTGYSSLSYLRHFHLDGLKLDRSFISELDNATDAAIVAAVIAMARALDITVIAEGVETATQLGMLQDLGCPLAQGYYFARPMPACDVAQWTRHNAFTVAHA